MEITKSTNMALVGASNNAEKFGFKIYRDLRKKGYSVVPVNHKESLIQGDKCFGSLKEMEIIPDLVIIVTPPAVTEKIVEECGNLGIKNIWVQPGAESDKAIRFCEENNIEVVHHSCIMLNS